MSGRGHRGSIGGGGRGRPRGTRCGRPAPVLTVSDGLPPLCRRCKAVGFHVPMCVGCACVRAGLPEDAFPKED